MRHSVFAVLSVIVPIAGSAPAQTQSIQDQLIKNFSVTQVEKFITEPMKAKIDKTQDRDNNTVSYATPDGQFDILVRGGAAKSILFTYDHSSLKSTLDKLNEWNSRGACTYAYFGKNGHVILAARLSLEGGLTYGQFTNFYDRIQQERAEFEKAVVVK
jgi:Putative bacterial sensory transduction regulator